ncbi:alkaline phosphatase [Alkalicoccobacillus gibsonii]|uniref:Alkaline phosphatase n=1 Tax=Alkalicoccobacillus gibsonii TaxID=79881 RepID=A0ABU9VIL5_9BACI
MKKKISMTLVATTLVTASIFPLYHAYGSDSGETGTSEHDVVKNTIFLIPDGFSTAYADSYRLYKEDGLPVWDEYQMLSGMISTHSADSMITDSAAAGTAFATGVKTNNGVIGLSPDGEKLQTIVDLAGQAGKKNGLVATSTITHATPAAFATSVDGRNDYEGIAKQLVQHEHLDVLLGGGRDQFLAPEQGGIREDGIDLIQEAEQNGFTYMETKRNLLSAETDPSKKYLGLFADEALEPDFGPLPTEPSLAEMTSFAIDHLSQSEEGFFLMVEGSQIDWAGHDNDAAYAMKDSQAFEEAVKVALEFAEEDQETLIVMAGDHDTGGLSIQPNDEFNPGNLQHVKMTGEDMLSLVDRQYSNLEEVLTEQTSMSFTTEELDQIKNHKEPKLAINTLISEKAGMAWTSNDHTAIDVPIYAYGPKASLFNGQLDNTDVFQGIRQALIGE